MQNVPERLIAAADALAEVIREMICHEIDVIVSEDNEWFTEQVDAAVKTYLFAVVAETLKEKTNEKQHSTDEQ